MCGLQLVSSSTILAQDTTAAATDRDGDGPEPPGHVKKRLTKKLHFLERVADSKRQALSATAGIRKKAHKSKHKQQKPLPDLSSLADLLAEVGQKQQQQAPEAGQGADGQPNKQKGRTEQITGSKARRAVTYVSPPLCAHGAFQTHATAFACIRLYSRVFIHLLSATGVCRSHHTSECAFYNKLAVVGSFKCACLVWCSQVETRRMQQVLAHPDFQANPLAAIRNHLAATLPEPAPAKPQSRNKQQPRRPKQKMPKSEAAMMQS